MCTNTDNKISEIDTKRIELFKEFITESHSADTVRKSLTRVYANYTQMLINNAHSGVGAFISTFNDAELYHLSNLIEILEGGYD